MTIQSFLALFQLSFAQPKQAAEAVLALNIPREALWLLVSLAVILSTISGVLGQTIATPTEQQQQAMQLIPTNPVLFLVMYAVFIVAFMGAVHVAGLAFKSQGSFDECVVVLSWWLIISNTARIMGLFLALLSPMLGGLVLLGLVGYGIWILVNFADVIFRFNSLGKSALMLFLAFMGLVFAAAMILAIFGFTPPEGAANV